MSSLPTLRTARLTLRPFTLDDAPAVQRLAGAREVALNTLHVPHPYPDGAAEEWISTHADDFDKGKAVTLAIDDGQLAGAILLLVDEDHGRGELGYWIGMPFWRRGYATEASRALIDYGFADLGLNRVFSMHFTRNPASGNVLKKLMNYEGLLRQHVRKWDEYVDLAHYGVLRDEWLSNRSR